MWNSQLLRYAGHRMADMYASSIASVKPHVLKLLSFAPNIAVTVVAVTVVAYRFALPAYVAFQHTHLNASISCSCIAMASNSAMKATWVRAGRDGSKVGCSGTP